MTATDELRRLLDERGVEYKDRNVFGKHVFHWGKPFHGAMFTDGGEWTELVVENATPVQAVEATLGSDLLAENAKLRELCRDMYEDIVCGCAECFFSEYDEHRGKPSECSNCGCGYRQIADRMMELEVDA